jgi:hypoxanthine phosphoribosyltransferase
VDQGDTLKVVEGYLSEGSPNTLEVTVLFKKPWAKSDPDYYLEVVDGWVVFPFELSEVNRLGVANGDVSPASAQTLCMASRPPNI